MDAEREYDLVGLYD